MDINRFCLGTVQLGKDYGINNKTGLLTEQEVFDLLDKAYRNGIRQFDTAADYGRSELILGKYIYDRGLKNKLNIVSKLPYNIKNNILNEVKKALYKLKIDSFYGLMFHNQDNIYDLKLVEQLKEIKKLELVNYIGVSVYEPKQALDAVNSDWVDIIQVPYNILDQRLHKTDFFKVAREKNIKVYARSSFLQGLLLMDYRSIPRNLQGIVPYLKKLDAFLNNYNITRKQVAISFVYANKAIDYIVFGIDNKSQLEDYFNIIKEDGYLFLMPKLIGYFNEIEEKLINPSKWYDAT